MRRGVSFVSLPVGRDDAVRRPLKTAHCGSQKLQKVASETITPSHSAVGVMGPRPGLRAEPKPATGVGYGPANLPVTGEGLNRWNPRRSRRGGGQSQDNFGICPIINCEDFSTQL
ncbi:hypothetical protein DRN41_01830 [Thermococci archaeon]|nr:MAG: hypothetical protein DRN41_01830 [Thermococci archaeon]